MNGRQKALLALGNQLRADGYHFVAPTPLTYQRVLARAPRSGFNPLTEAFGWNRPFDEGGLEARYRDLLQEADLAEKAASGQSRSLVRFSSLHDLLFVHSGYPTDRPDAVFFGPDTYRFGRALAWLAEHDRSFCPKTMVDVGTGTGAGGVYGASLFPSLERVILADISPKALELAQVNVALNGCTNCECRQSDLLAGIDLPADLIVSNPPYLVDRAKRAYRHGGGDWGCALAVRIVEQALTRLTPAGRLLLYTGAPIVAGADMFLTAVEPLLRRRTNAYRYEETDPDVFGEELEHPPYDQADRIATAVLYVKASDIIR